MSYYRSNEVRTKRWHWYVYILECQDELYYTGMTWNIDIRLEQHALGLGSKFTSKHGFKEIRYVEEFNDITAAREREVQLKDFSRKKKEVLWMNEE
jgi:predicted GIY-YIG superfamily endonuclease